MFQSRANMSQKSVKLLSKENNHKTINNTLMYDVYIFSKRHLDSYNFLLWTIYQLQLIEESHHLPTSINRRKSREWWNFLLHVKWYGLSWKLFKILYIFNYLLLLLLYIKGWKIALQVYVFWKNVYYFYKINILWLLIM